MRRLIESSEARSPRIGRGSGLAIVALLGSLTVAGQDGGATGRRARQWGSKGTGPGQFQIPHGIATDGKVLYVADRTNARVQRFDLEGQYLGEWTHLGRPFALKFSGGALWVSGMTLEAQGASPWLLQVDPATGKVLGQVESPGPHAIDVNDAGDAFATGCCGGKNPMGFFWLRHAH